jgi:WD40 repeat protein
LESPDGKYHKEFPLHQNSSSKIVLRYLSGHRLLITSPVTEDNSAEERDRVEDKAFSVLDAETGKVLQVVPGPHPGGRAPDNEANDLAISPDERFVAVICGRKETQVNIYSTGDWKQVATLAVGHTVDAHGLAFSPDGRALAVFFGRRDSRIKFFEVGSWSLSGSLEAYPDSSPAMGVVGISALSFSPDGAMIAVGASSGGSWWTYPEGTTVLPGIGVLLPGTAVLKIYFPADPLRVYRIFDGSLVASLGSFPGGFSLHGLVWSPNGKYLAFQDGVGGIRFWNPFQPDLSVVVARKGVLPLPSIQFSRDGSQLAADSWDGLKVFDVVPPR